jgi:GT2 family glycosyltransferase
MTSVDIVIPCAGRAHDLLRLLESIHNACGKSLPRLCLSITVTDDRHTDELRKAVTTRFPAVNYVAGPARGPAANRNHGSTLGNAEWILFLDDDCFLRGDLLQAYADCLRVYPQANVLEGAIHAVGERPNGNHHAPLNTTGGVLWSCNLLVKRSVFAAVGRFDEEFPFACLEDCDLADRLRGHPAQIAFAGEAVVFHPWRSVSEREVSRAIISHAIYAEKHPEYARKFDFVHLLRSLLGRVRQYRLGRFSSIPWAKYRTVAFDLIAPLMVYAVIRVAPLRRLLWNRYRNRVPVAL